MNLDRVAKLFAMPVAPDEAQAPDVVVIGPTAGNDEGATVPVVLEYGQPGAGIPDPAGPCAACAGRHWWLAPAGSVWRCSRCSPAPAELLAGCVTLTLSGPVVASAATWRPEMAGCEAAAPVKVSLPGANESGVLVQCAGCRHFVPNPSSPGQGIGHCQSGADAEAFAAWRSGRREMPRALWPLVDRRCTGYAPRAAAKGGAADTLGGACN